MGVLELVWVILIIMDGEWTNSPPDVIGEGPLEFEPRDLKGVGHNITLLDLIGKANSLVGLSYFGASF